MFMRRCAFLVIAVAGMLALAACSDKGLLVVTDQYWQQARLRNGNLKDNLTRMAEQTGVTLDVVQLAYGGNTKAKLVATLTRNREPLVLLSPLYSAEAATLAAEFSGRVVISFATVPRSSSPGASGPHNLVSLVSDPGPIFKSAAKRAEQYLVSRDPRKAGGAYQIAAVFGDDKQGQSALAGFRSGLDDLASPPDLSVIQVGGSADRSRLGRFLKTAQAKEVDLYVLGAPAVNAYAFELLKDNTTPIVTENWVYGSTYSGKVAFSLDEDIASAVRKVVETMGTLSDNEIRIPWDIATAAGHS